MSQITTSLPHFIAHIKNQQIFLVRLARYVVTQNWFRKQTQSMKYEAEDFLYLCCIYISYKMDPKICTLQSRHLWNRLTMSSLLLKNPIWPMYSTCRGQQSRTKAVFLRLRITGLVAQEVQKRTERQKTSPIGQRTRGRDQRMIIKRLQILRPQGDTSHEFVLLIVLYYRQYIAQPYWEEADFCLYISDKIQLKCS